MGVLVWSWRCSLQSDSWTAAVDNDMLRSWCLVLRPALHCQWNGRCGFMMRVNSVPLQHSSRPASRHKHGLHRHRNCWGCFQPFSIRGAGVRRVWRLSFIWQTDVTSVSEKHYSQHKNNRFNLLVSPSLQSHTEPQRERVTVSQQQHQNVAWGLEDLLDADARLWSLQKKKKSL